MSIAGFTRAVTRRERPAIAIFGQESTGKTALAASAGTWAKAHGTIPGWLVTDRKTAKTMSDRCRELGLELPYHNTDPFVRPEEAAQLIRLDRWNTEANAKVQALYAAICGRFFDAAAVLAADPSVDPVVIDLGTTVYDWMAYSYNGKKQDVGMQTKWGPPQSDWKDLMDGLQHKHVIVTFWARDEWKGGATTGRTLPDGPKTLGYTVTTTVRMNFDKEKKLSKDETFVDRFSLDIWSSQDNAGLSGVDGVLRGSQITFTELIGTLRPEDV